MKKFLCFILIFVIVFSFSGCSYIFASKLDSNQADVIECPNFVGMTFEEFKNHEVVTYGLLEIKLDYINSNEYDAGVVCYQSISEGKKLKEGDSITIYISKGA